MNRSLLLIYLVAAPTVAFAALYVLGVVHLWSGFPLVWVNCLLIIGSLSFGFGQCGYYFDWAALLPDVLFYTGWAYALLGCYKLLKGRLASA